MLLSLSCSTGFNHCLIHNSDRCLIHNSSPRCFRHALVYRMTPFPVLTRPHWGAAPTLASISCRTRMRVFSWFATCLVSNGFLIHSSLLAFSWATSVIELSQIVQIAFEVEPQAKSPCKKYRWNARPVALRCGARRILFDAL